MGETTRDALRRELSEETGLDVPARVEPLLLGVYDDPRRDNRRHIASAVYALEIPANSRPRAASDVKDVVRIKWEDIGTKFLGKDLYADHFTILLDYIDKVRGNVERQQGERQGEVVANLVRSQCIQ